ncbi:hypothetical protein YC2023_104368 [Brassica napus]
MLSTIRKLVVILLILRIIFQKMAWSNRFLQNLHHALTLSSKNHQEVERLLMPQKDGDR